MPHVIVRDINMYYEIHGEGQPLVLIHGLASDVSEWTWLIEALSKDHRLLTFDSRGVGRTDMPKENYSIEQMAEDACLLMQAVDFPAANIIGVSMGGRVAIELAITHPEMVKKLILVSTAARAIRSWQTKLLFNFLPRLPFGKGRHPQPYWAFRRQERAARAYNGTNRLARIKARTLILYGAHDALVPRLLIDELSAGIDGSRVVTFAGGHGFFLFRERDPFLRAVDQFLASP